jgi:hypothetical protein
MRQHRLALEELLLVDKAHLVLAFAIWNLAGAGGG